MISCTKTIYLILLLLFIVLSAPTTVVAGATTLCQSVDQALASNPELQAVAHANRALQYDLKQSRGGYLPSVDLLLAAGAELRDSDWDSPGDATLRLTQKVYDGGETGSQISIQKALLELGDYQLQAAAQAISLAAVTAHLNVFWQRELVFLAEKTLKIHRDIYQLLAEREQAGAGSIADVTQAQARLARAESTLYLSQADLSQAIANYTRVIGGPPEELARAGVPETLPQTLEEALQRTEQDNPELLALDAEIAEADSRVALARSKHKPRIDLELSSRYDNHLDGDQSWGDTGDQSWEYTNTAKLLMRWNLFNGGQDKAGANSALSRKHQSRSRRTAKLIELREATSTAWANYLSSQRQKRAYRDAVDYSRKTSDAYLEQFSVSQRSLLDVLIAENDHFHSGVQLVAVSMNETIAAYRILALMGVLQVPRCAGVREYPEGSEYSAESQTIVPLRLLDPSSAVLN
jgi:adhesin transport system outer membrane protein